MNKVLSTIGEILSDALNAKGIIARVVTITPQIALDIWENHRYKNRKIYPTVVDRYVREIKNGRWKVNNQSIGFDINGKMYDGQHRIKAIIDANIPITTLISFNVPEKDGDIYTQDTVDQHRARSVGDVLMMAHDVQAANEKVAIMNVIVLSLNLIGRGKLTPSEAYQIINLYDDELEFILSDRSNKTRGLKYSPALAAMVFAAKVDLDKAIEFKNGYYFGNDLAIESPILAYRTFIINRTPLQKEGGNGSHRQAVFNYGLQAMYCYIKTKRLKKVTSSLDGFDYFTSKQKGHIELLKGILGR